MQQNSSTQNGVWQQRKKHGIEFWVHVPTRKCGINIRGLAILCGVTHETIRRAVQNAEKPEGEVAALRKTELYTLLKDKVIFLKKWLL